MDREICIYILEINQDKETFWESLRYTLHVHFYSSSLSLYS